MMVDAVLFLNVFGLLLTGLLIAFVLPPRSHMASVWGLTRHSWGELHFYLAVSALVVMFVHLVLHWSWVCTVASRLIHRAATPTAWQRRVAGVVGLGFVVAVVLVFLAAAELSKRPDSPHGARHGHQAESVAPLPDALDRPGNRLRRRGRSGHE